MNWDFECLASISELGLFGIYLQPRPVIFLGHLPGRQCQSAENHIHFSRCESKPVEF